jgi:LysM repeat protein
LSKIFRKFQNSLKRLNFRGFFKEPSFYLGLILVILFSLLLVSLPKSKGLGRNFAEKLTGKITNSQNLFLSSAGGFLIESPNLFFIQKNSLKAVSSPQVINPKVLGSLFGESDSGGRREILEYTVQSGDTLSKIAENFGISLETVLWANDLTKNSKISLGQKLIILPVSGVMHLVEKDDTLSGIAKRYQVDVESIVTFNNLSENGEIFRGDLLIIPNGIKPPEPAPYYAKTELPNTYFIFPAIGKISQGLHFYNAIDIANKCGTPIYAAAGGQIYETRYNSWPTGNFIKIEHPNGVITLYGHLSKILVTPGQMISQGDLIGYMGATGLATGCHLHFDVLNRGVVNPLSKYLVGTYLNWQ